MKITAGELALHPVALTSLAVLVVNDRWLKSAWPGFVTGKLSDCAGLVLLPIGLLSLAEILRGICRRPLIRQYDPLAWVALSVFGFVLVKVTPLGNDAYAWAMGAIRWPLEALTDVSSWPQIRPVPVSRDPTDLLALAAVPLAFLLIRNRARAAECSVAAERSRLAIRYPRAALAREERESR